METSDIADLIALLSYGSDYWMNVGLCNFYTLKHTCDGDKVINTQVIV